MKLSFTKSWTVILTVLALIFSVIGVTPAHADSLITVDTTADNTTLDGHCTLREAIYNADHNNGAYTDCAAGSGNDTIVFASSLGTATIQVDTLGVFTISDSAGLTIDGDNRITLSGYDSTRLFIVNGGVTLTFKNIAIVRGYAAGGDGGAIYNYGTLIIDSSKFSGNRTGTSNSGGAIISQGPLTVSNSEFANNSAGNGGAIYSRWAAALTTISNSSFHDNSTSNTTNGWGGALLVWDGAVVTITNHSTFSVNSAIDGGGIYNNNGKLTISNSTFSSNTAADGGGIYNYSGTANITDSTFSKNNLVGRGGGIYNRASLLIYNNTFSDNGAVNFGGGIYNEGGPLLDIDKSAFSGNGAGDSGGGVYTAGTTIITNSTFSGNSTSFGRGGGIYFAATVVATIMNSAFSGNNAGTYGGGIYTGANTLKIANSTFSGNGVDPDGGMGGGIYINAGATAITNSTLSGNNAAHGGGIDNNGGSTILRNTIVANNASGGNCFGAIANMGNNIDSGTSCGWGSTASSMSGTDPLLGALTGSPAYFPLKTGSLAIDAGNDAICAAAPVYNESQNGVTRPQGAHCDIGSFELVRIFLPLVVR